MRTNLRPRVLGVLLSVVALTGAACSTPLASPQSAAPASTGAGAPGDADAPAYCTEQGGALVTRIPTWNTNSDPQAQLILGGERTFCEFESTQPGDQEPTRISVDLVTLSSEQPTIAAVAYLSKLPPVVPDQPSANPAQYNCIAQLKGTAEFGNTNTAGGWVDASQPVFSVMNYCFFADGSAIDEFGIFYYGNGTIRGADLAPLLRYQAGDKLPAMFERMRQP